MNTKLVRVFVLQVLAISVATVMGVYGAALVVEKVLVQEALNGEAEHFWANYREDHSFPLPNTNNLRGYMARQSSFHGVPEWLQDVPAGFQRVDAGNGERPVVFVSDEGADRLYLVFDEVQVSSLAFYFGIAPLTAVLLLIYLLTWIGYVLSRRAVSTVVQLSEMVRNYDFNSGQFEKFCPESFGDTSDSEVVTLVNAFNQFIERMEAFIQRERNFTRNASHELRTPLAVVKANLDLLKKFDEPERRQRVVERMSRTVRDMEALVETLLILARETESKLNWSSVVLNDLVAEIFDQVVRAVPKAEVSVGMHARGLLEVDAPERVLAIVFTNLLRNALTYTEKGRVDVFIDHRGVSIKDTGCGMSEADLERMFEPFYRGHDRSNEGYGLGLAIVRRLCDRFGWSLQADSEIGVGTEIRVGFPRASFKRFSDASD
ncbi:sensor histidine kinase [Wenzhouxiangella marina]|uniref:sensor histidine kinase n=1 Tax=Wenzhouxiangella marina TaxID=1579979 RepID=UPI00146FD82A|nr:HAMP domain-containing sensor histidine kinase [Wenzhouxiangella marina]MBB6085956.1 signal transduction histidine kinase [Wenzhouxiangella marina]